MGAWALVEGACGERGTMTQLAVGIVNPLQQWFGDDNLPLANGFVKTYAAGTTTPLLTYKDALLIVPNSTTIALDAEGKAVIYLQPLAYKIDVQDANGVSIDGYPQDFIAGFVVPLTADNGVNDFRLTLTSGVPVTNADVTAALTVFCTPSGLGNRIALFDSAGTANLFTSAEFSISVPASASQMYDVFCFNNNGVPTLELLATSRTDMTGLTLATTGVWTKTGDLTRRWLGCVRTTTVSGQTEDSATKRFLWNYYNRAKKSLIKQGASSWTYTTATLRQANADAANQVEAINGIADNVVSLRLVVAASNSAGTTDAFGFIGLDSTTAASSQQSGGYLALGGVGQLQQAASTMEIFPAAGYHKYVWLEAGDGVGTTTWFGSFTVVGAFKSGLYGSVWC